MKNIAILIHDITNRAGTERAVCNLANMLVEYGEYSPKIVSLYSSQGEAAYLLNEKIKIIHWKMEKPNNKFKQIIEYIILSKKLTFFCKKNSVNIIIGTIIGINIPMFFVENKNITKIACEHFNYDTPSAINKYLRKLFYPKLDAVVVLTSRDKEKYYFCKNVSIIPNSLSFVPQKQSSVENKIILSVGRITYQKGFERLVDAIALIKEKCLGWQVKIIGDGEDKETIKKQIKNCGLENIVVILPPTDNIEEEYCDASIYAMSSHYEGLPMVLIEAKSCGLPIVSFDCPNGPKDIIRDGIDGFLVENGNIKALADAILKLIENPKLRKKYGQEAINDSERLSPKRIFNLWNSLFKEKLCYCL